MRGDAEFIIVVCCIFVSGLTVSQNKEENIKSSDSSTIKLFLAGDVMTGRGIDQALSKSVDPVLYESYIKDAQAYLQLAERENGTIKTPVSFKYIWNDALKVWAKNKPDFRIINLETGVTTHDEPWPRKGIHYRMHPGNTELLEVAHIDYCSLANNHVLDWGRPGLEETLQSLNAAGIKYSGVGENSSAAAAPAVLKLDNVRMLIFSYGTGNSGIPPSWAATKGQSGVNYIKDVGDQELEAIKALISDYEQPGDLVVLSIHWGGNWGYHVSENQREFSRRLIDDAGVDIIFGHSSHHPMGIEVYNEKLILYGAGDFINDYEGISGHEKYRPELSLMYFPEIDLVNGNLKSLEMVPMEIKNFRLNHATAQQAKWLKTVLTREGRILGTSVKVTNDNSLWLEW